MKQGRRRKSTITNYRTLLKTSFSIVVSEETNVSVLISDNGKISLSVTNEGEMADAWGMRDRKLSSLTSPIIKVWKDALFARQRTDETTGEKIDCGLEFTTVSHSVSLLSSAIDECRRSGLYQGENPVEPVLGELNAERQHGELYKAPMREGADFPTDEEAVQYLQAATLRGIRHEVRERVKATCGLRISELRGLLWSEVNLNPGHEMMHIINTADDDGKLQDRTKTGAGFRDLSIPPDTADALRRWRPICPWQDAERIEGIDTTPENAETIARYLITNPDAPTIQIAQHLGVSHNSTQLVREYLIEHYPHFGLSQWSYSYRLPLVMPPEDSDCPLVDSPLNRNGVRRIRKERAQQCARLIWHNRDASHMQLAEELSVERKVLSGIRKQLGLPELPKGVRNIRKELKEPDPYMPKVLNKSGKEWLVFPDEDGNVQARSTLYRWAGEIQVAAWGKCADRGCEGYAGAKYGDFNHVWRHFYCSTLLAHTREWHLIAYLMGHRNLNEIVRTYGHLKRDMRRDRALVTVAFSAPGATLQPIVTEGDRSTRQNARAARLPTKSPIFPTDQLKLL